MAKRLEAAHRLQQGQVDRGLCNYPGCSNKHEVNRKKCQQHLDLCAAQMRKLRDGYIAAGKCPLCRENPLVEGFKHCQDCLRAEAARVKETSDGTNRYHELKSLGLCTKCAKVPAVTDSIYCDGCRDRRRGLQKGYDAARRAAEKVRRADHNKLVFAHYGTICKCCSQDWPIEMLQIGHVDDHVPADVVARRGGISRKKFRAWLVKQGFPEGFITLCVNCNHAWWNSRCCPHARERLVPDVVDGEAVFRDPQTGKVFSG
jgi:hypothetical protein